MKKIIICLVLLVIICGCKKNEVIPENNYFIKELKPLKTFKIECNELKEAKEIRSNLFITKNGELFLLSADKLFSNNKNCKKIDTNIKFDKYFGSYYGSTAIILGEDGNLYEIHEDYNVYRSNEDSFPPKSIRNKLFFTHYGYFEHLDNKISKYKVFSNPYNIFDNTENSDELLLDDNEKIMYLSPNSIITSKSIYYLEKIITNKEECNKYADIKCNYKIVWKETNEFIKNKLSNILYYTINSDTFTIIDTDLNMYIYYLAMDK